MAKAVTPFTPVRARFFDRCGKPLAGGKVYTYAANSTTPKATYADAYGLTENTNPVLLDMAGEADIYLNGTYRIRVVDRFGAVVNDNANVGTWVSAGTQASLDDLSGALDGKITPMVEAITQQAMGQLSDLQSAIDAAAAAGAGANGWTTDLVVEDGLTQKQINAAQSAIFANKKIKQIAGALRNDGTGWTFITDTLHNPINVTSVTVENGIDLKVNFFNGVKVISGMVVCDESYSRIGLQVGASVATNALAIRGYLPLEFSVTTDGANAPIVNAIAEIKSRITASRSGTKIRINHTGAVNDYPQVTPLSGSLNAKPIDVTSTAMNILQETGSSPYYFRIWYASGTWNFTTNMSGATLDTSTFATTGDIKFNFTTALTGNDYLVQSTSDRYKGSISKIYSPGLSGFTVRFVDPATNAYMTSVPADAVVDSVIQYGVQKNGVNTATVLPAGTYNVKRGLIPVYWDEIKSPDSYGGNANLWFIAIIEY